MKTLQLKPLLLRFFLLFLLILKNVHPRHSYNATCNHFSFLASII